MLQTQLAELLCESDFNGGKTVFRLRMVGVFYVPYIAFEELHWNRFVKIAKADCTSHGNWVMFE